MSGNSGERTGDGGSDRITISPAPRTEDPLQAERYGFWGPTGSATENTAAGRQAANPATAQNERLQYDNQQNMTLSSQDQQKMMVLWANANGMDANDEKSYSQVSKSADGKSVAVGPFKLDAGTIANDWLDGMVNGQGLVDRAALDNYVQQGKISPQTADAVSSPEFMNFMQKMAAGQQPSAEEMAKFLPKDLQQAIAGDLANAGAAIVGMQGGTLDTQTVLKTIQGFSAQAGPMQDFAALQGDPNAGYNQGFEITDGSSGPPRQSSASLENTSLPGATYNPDPDNVADGISVLPIEGSVPVTGDGTDSGYQPTPDYTTVDTGSSGAVTQPGDTGAQ